MPRPARAYEPGRDGAVSHHVAASVVSTRDGWLDHEDRLVISDAHEGLKAAANRVLGATARRCKVHVQRNAMAHAGKTQRRIVAA